MRDRHTCGSIFFFEIRMLGILSARYLPVDVQDALGFLVIDPGWNSWNVSAKFLRILQGESKQVPSWLRGRPRRLPRRLGNRLGSQLGSQLGSRLGPTVQVKANDRQFNCQLLCRNWLWHDAHIVASALQSRLQSRLQRRLQSQLQSSVYFEAAPAFD